MLTKSSEIKRFLHLTLGIAQLAGTVEYSDCTSAEGVRIHTTKYTGYDTKQSDGEVPVMLALLGIWSTSSLPSFSGPL